MATDFVYVGSKAPYPLILNLKSYEVVNKEHGTIRTNGDDLPTVTLKGNSVRVGQPDLSIDGFVFTKVPKEFWEKWLADHADFPMLRDGFIKVAASVGDQNKIGAEHANEPAMFSRLSEDDKRVKNLGAKPYDSKDEAA